MSAPRPSGATATPAAYPFTWVLQTRFSDLDVNWHTNNVAMIGYLQEARIRYMDHIGAPQDGPETRWLVAGLGISFLAEGRYPADARVHVGVLRIGTTSTTLAHLVTQEDAAIAYAEATLVFANTAGPAPIEGALRKALVAASMKDG